MPAVAPLKGSASASRMILAAMVALSLLGLLVAPSGDTSRRQVGVAAVLVLVVLAASVGAGTLKVRTDAAKTLKDSDRIEAGDWGAVFRVDAVDLGTVTVLNHDGLWGSSVWPYDGTPATTDRFLEDNRRIPYAALPDGPRVLIIGAAGGNEIMASLTYGASHVDAVELNPVTVNLLRNTFADYSGHVVDDRIQLSMFAEIGVLVHGRYQRDSIRQQCAKLFAAATLASMNAADPDHPTVKPVPYTGVQFVAIPEFQGIGTKVGELFSAALAGQISADEALAQAQQFTTDEMTKAGYIK